MQPKPVCPLRSYQTFRSWPARPSQTSRGNCREDEDHVRTCGTLEEETKQTKATEALGSPRQRIHGDGRWFFETSIEQNLLLGSVEVGNRYGFGAEVRPVQVLVDPVHRNADGRLDIFDHFLVSADFPFFVQYGPARGKTWTKIRHSRVN